MFVPAPFVSVADAMDPHVRVASFLKTSPASLSFFADAKSHA
jgi:hypothetical protein